ncbi:short-chain dehydrogenase [Pseudooceanicola lipolyticus]|uniref:Short-chain dehydrogenase n=1 Tax=Pseudooceanicola lipolyticus TaxID=2029104 RepID=A0A2M8IZN0_9RHOB|nr:SDR family oxidoreductase [Pseudooceanicola lipolyticus]PJE35977.1 short-chain dehydrogenase [Pseudooceanicola lipolyticus]
MNSILITGASSGIGRATAELFLAEGWRVGLLARRADVLEELAAKHDGAVPLVADVTQADQVAAAFDSFTARAGRLDVLFNNAGIFTAPGTIDEIPLDHWHSAVAVNLSGMFLAARCAFAAMRAQQPQGGRIINNGSISAHVPRPGAVTYTTTKHAITGLTRQLSLDGRPFDIACGQIDIGNAETPMVAELKQRALAEGGEVPETMAVEDAARSVLHMAKLPLAANVQFMTVMATKMPYIGRG